MRITIIDFLTDGCCELTGRSGECVKVMLDPQTPPAIVSTTHFIKLIRFHAQQEAKRAAATAAKERTAQGNS